MKFSEALTLLILLDSDQDGRRSADRLKENNIQEGHFILLHVNFPVNFHQKKWRQDLQTLNPHAWDRECWIEELLSPEVHRDFVAMPIEEVRTLLPDTSAESEPPSLVIRKKEEDYRAIPPARPLRMGGLL